MEELRFLDIERKERNEDALDNMDTKETSVEDTCPEVVEKSCLQIEFLLTVEGRRRNRRNLLEDEVTDDLSSTPSSLLFSTTSSGRSFSIVEVEDKLLSFLTPNRRSLTVEVAPCKVMDNAAAASSLIDSLTVDSMEVLRNGLEGNISRRDVRRPPMFSLLPPLCLVPMETLRCWENLLPLPPLSKEFLRDVRPTPIPRPLSNEFLRA